MRGGGVQEKFREEIWKCEWEGSVEQWKGMSVGGVQGGSEGVWKGVRKWWGGRDSGRE